MQPSRRPRRKERAPQRAGASMAGAGPGLGSGRTRFLMVLLFSVQVVLGTMGPTGARAQELDPDLLEAFRPRSIGPAGMSGRITSIDALHSDPDLVYVGTATGGVWKSENGGHTWDPIFDGQALLGIGAVAVFQENPDIVWVGTGEGNPRNSAGVGAGLFKSLDGGRTWNSLGLEGSERIHRIVLHPQDPETAWVGAMGPAWSDGDERGVFRTTDGGETWERVLWVDERTGVSDLVMDPTNPNKLLAAMWEFRREPWFFRSGGPGSGLYLTYDGGDTWRELTPEEGLPPGDLGRIGLAVASNEPHVVYALVEAARSALLRSDDGGEHWQTVNDDGRIAPRPFYYADIRVDPTNELRLFNLHSRLERSEDGGRTFHTLGQGVHSDLHALWIHPSEPDLMYLGTDGGVYVSRDGGTRWRFVDNLPVGQFYHLSVDMDVPFNVYGGMQDNGSWRGPSDVWERGGIRNHHWREVGFGDGFGTLPDRRDPELGYGMSQGGGLFRYDLRTGEVKGIRPWAPDGVELRFNWNAPIAPDPLAPEVIYYGSQFVHRTEDRGESWQIISGDLTTNDQEKQRQEESGGLTIDATGAENHTTLLTIAPSPVEPELIWVGSDDGLVHLTRSSGGEWTEVGERIRGFPDGGWVPHIEASHHGGGTAYVVVDDHRRGDWRSYIFKTEDYGRRWENLAEDRIRGFVHTLEEDPLEPNLLFAGTEFGLFVTLNGGEDWIHWRDGLPPAPVRSILVHPRDHDLVVGTHGRSIYIVDDIRPLRAMARDPSVLQRRLALFEPPRAYLFSEGSPTGYHFPGDAMFQGPTRPRGAMLSFLLGPASSWDSPAGPPTPIRMEIRTSDGTVIRTEEVPARPGLNRIGWDLREDVDPAFADSQVRQRFAMKAPEVLPGTYTVRLTLPGDTAEGTVQVLPDPRNPIPDEARLNRRMNVLRAIRLAVAAQEVHDKAQTVAREIQRVRPMLGPAGGDPGNVDSPVAQVEERMEILEGELDAIQDYRRGGIYSLADRRDSVTEAERIVLARMEEATRQAVGVLNGILTGPYSALRTRLESSGQGSLEEIGLVGLPQDGGT